MSIEDDFFDEDVSTGELLERGKQPLRELIIAAAENFPDQRVMRASDLVAKRKGAASVRSKYEKEIDEAADPSMSVEEFADTIMALYPDLS